MEKLRVRRSRNDEGGFSLIELLVSMTILAILMAVVMTAVVTMYKSLRKQTGQTDVLDASRKVVAALDKQFRYANSVTSPGTGSSGATYIEWRTGNTYQQQTCTQWRYLPGTGTTGTLAYRTWQPPLTSTSPTAASTLTGWRTQSDGITLPTTGSMFDITPTIGAGATATHVQLSVAFRTTDGKPNTVNKTQVGFTALNTPNSSPAGSTVCTEGGRP